MVYQTHVFAPVVTGAPTKKTKFPNTSASTPNLDTPSTTGTAQPVSAAATAPAVPFASVNAQGQRICRQCGMVGRYKDGKCVEKWGPGPMGPGTVCDRFAIFCRCRKKMKRVERRGTLDQQQHQLASAVVVQAQQHQPIPRSGSHSQLPLSQGSDRSIHRSDTLLTNQSPHGGGSFRDESSIQTSSGSSHARGPAVMLGAMPSPTPATKRQQPPPPSIAALRDDDDEDDDDNDGPDIPTSNIGRGGSTSRSGSRNGRVRPLDGGANGGSKRSLLGVSRTAHSISPRDTDADGDADGDAEADAEILGAVDAADLDGDGEGDADAEAELLEAVDAAEANSSSSHGDRTWKDEPM
ncbi:hypothetical protein BDN70DRAFT_594437 [Pholiota conissans]|uniref:Uncharacterized protein n=1 Tax=Pholiota conissans TaxID=109636 RepID=A0A9P5Z5T0_9AGAR|nr:hypothetical protein BDN70DRAFT_594437 [Pholiota conissans]